MRKTWNEPERGSMGTPAPIGRRELLGLFGAAAGLGLASAGSRNFGVAAAGLQTVARNANVAFPKDAVIRTVLKDVSPDALATAATLFHEHLSFEWARVRGPNGRGPESLTQFPALLIICPEAVLPPLANAGAGGAKTAGSG